MLVLFHFSVGLGCSSFSTFFFTKDELAAESNNDAAASITVDALTRDHPKVREWIETIRYAIEDCGISLLDTAPWYGHGTSEIVVGWALDETLVQSSSEERANDESPPINREDLCINTKVGRYEADPAQQFDFSREATLASAKRSLERLFPGCTNDNDDDNDNHRAYIDVLQLHDPEFSPTLEVLLNETIPAMVECRSRGWCKALGLTGYPLEVQYQILGHSLEKYGRDAGKIWDQALTYGHFNLHDSSLIHRRVDPSRESFAAVCHNERMGLLAAAPLSMGLLTHDPPPAWHPAMGSALADACREAASVCRGLGVDIATLALVYAMSHPSLPCTILGMKNVAQVRQAVAIARRFRMVDWTIPDLTQETILSFVLTVPERKAHAILSDPEHGPFAGVWSRETADDYDGHGIFAPKFQWDGIREAHDFWEAQGAPFDDWQEKSFR